MTTKNGFDKRTFTRIFIHEALNEFYTVVWYEMFTFGTKCNMLSFIKICSFSYKTRRRLEIYSNQLIILFNKSIHINSDHINTFFILRNRHINVDGSVFLRREKVFEIRVARWNNEISLRKM